ncbi:urea transporter [Pedobacter foliorum]|uniref:urea transporter n=1 Tax=Pedobacter foliorum TaxID=2739058 RepID=UPI001563E78A|nr:urea transporter [Pedobacter foliorum]NRF42018.1 urea transporter [Pedobacter foliorum]
MELLERKLPFLSTLLKGVGQIMLQENALTGLLFLLGIFYGSILMGLGAVLAVLAGTLTAKVLGYDKKETEQGLYGFSAALVGVALTLFFKPVIITWVAIIIGSALATIIQHWCIVKKIPVFTLPFVLVTWALIYIFHHIYPIAAPELLTAETHITNDFTFALRGFGEVIFQGSAISGIIFFIAVFINSPISALYGIAGAILAATLSALFSAPTEAIEMGLFSYNAVLCAIVFAGDKPKDGAWAAVAVILSVFIAFLMNKFNFIQLTFPFVAATCITLAVKNLNIKQRLEQTITD